MPSGEDDTITDAEQDPDVKQIVRQIFNEAIVIRETVREAWLDDPDEMLRAHCLGLAVSSHPLNIGTSEDRAEDGALEIALAKKFVAYIKGNE